MKAYEANRGDTAVAPNLGACPESRKRPRPHVLLVTGLSGAGKTTALKALEDVGYEAVDHLPLHLLPRLLKPLDGEAEKPLAIALDVRTRDFSVEVFNSINDTTGLPPAELKQILSGYFGQAGTSDIAIQVISFPFRSGLPRQADLVLDIRFLDNPFYQPNLRRLTRRDAAVARPIASDPAFKPFFHNLTCLLEPLLPRYHAERKSYLTIAIGCTGGRHRSVFVAEQLAMWLSHRVTHVQIDHRDLNDPDTRRATRSKTGTGK